MRGSGHWELIRTVFSVMLSTVRSFNGEMSSLDGSMAEESLTCSCKSFLNSKLFFSGPCSTRYPVLRSDRTLLSCAKGSSYQRLSNGIDVRN